MVTRAEERKVKIEKRRIEMSVVWTVKERKCYGSPGVEVER